MEQFGNELIETIASGTRRQDPLNPRKYRYVRAFDELVDDNTHIVAVVLFSFTEDEQGRPLSNNFIVTAFQKEIG